MDNSIKDIKQSDIYFSYLKTRSSFGLIYRKFWLYPVLCSFLQGRVLDIGCGIGDFVAFRPNTIGVDINPRTVAYCLDRGLDVRVMEQDKLPFKASEFDSVILDNVLEHITQPYPLLNEVARVMSDTGILIVGVPGRKGYASDPDHKLFYDDSVLVNTLNKASFHCERLFYMPFSCSWFDRGLRQYCLYGIFRRKSHISNA
jgi:SAM-dependent methyltransferase